MSDEPLHHFDPMPEPPPVMRPPPVSDGDHHHRIERPTIAPLKRMLGTIPPRVDPETNKDMEADDHSAAIGAHAASEANKRSEARRDGVLAVALAIKRRGGNPLTDWTTKDIDTAYAIAEQLTALNG